METIFCQCPECENRRRKLEEYGEPEHTPEEARLLFQLKTLQEKLERAKEAFKNLSPNRADFLAAGVSELHGWAEIAEDLKLYAKAARACLAELEAKP